MKTLLAVLLFAGSTMGQTIAQVPDYPAIKRQTQLFETVLDTAVRQRFEYPFLVLQEAKGAYLEGYGVVFTMEVNLSPLQARTPFSALTYSDKELAVSRAQKLVRIKELETLIRDLMRDHGMGLNFLGADENVAVVVHLFNSAEQKDLPSQLGVQTKKQWLQEAAGRRLNAAEFRQKFSVTSF
jgi:hypothetical protein